MDQESRYFEVIELIKRLRGQRTLAQFSNDCGVSVSNLSRLINGELKRIPTPNMLRKLTKLEANPQNGISYEEIMVVAGYNSPNEEIEIRNILMENMVKEDTKEFGISGPRAYSDIDRFNKAVQYEALAKGVICTRLAQRGISFIFDQNPVVNSDGNAYRPDVIIEIQSSNHIKFWWLEIKFCRDESMHSGLITRWFFNIINRFMLISPNNKQKVSLVLNSEPIYNQLKRLKDNIAYKGNLSIILVDMIGIKFIEETYISFYDEKQADGLLVD